MALKLTNLAALDDSLPQKGMAHASATDRAVWADFLATPDKVLAAFAAQQAPDSASGGDSFAERQAAFAARQSETRSASVSPRIGQSFFREVILTSYRGRCALTGNDDARLLTASHIVGWAEDETLRVNPANGICLNALHDRAFDRHLITFDEDYRLKIAGDVPRDARRALEKVESGRLEMPARFLPDQGFLDRHRRRFHARQRAV
ncbi:restriction endonuclease [Sinisalibacter aestuarii]|uniref:Restriction endonuclease n=1 Tax=Sinisalibacter aestuarii TaxID=2949426 RepID=A0ABQ5LWK5_9RHOB|nr:restriction endonuclease [Sinisalibacter aestuarii]